MIKDVLDDKEQVERCKEVYGRHIEGCDCEDCRIAKAAYDREFNTRTGTYRDYGSRGSY